MNLQALFDISYGMYVISAKFENRNVGCFINTVSQVTAENPIVTISVNKNNFTSNALTIGAKVGISILSEETDPTIIGKFGFFSSRDTNKFDGTKYEEINNVAILKENICGYLIAKVINVIDAETHNVILLRVVEAEKINNYKPMTYSYYHEVIKGKTPKTAPTYKEEADLKNALRADKYKCVICGYIYDDAKEKVKFVDLPADWKCPICGVGKEKFEKID